MGIKLKDRVVIVSMYADEDEEDYDDDYDE